MRIKHLSSTNLPPISKVEITDLASPVIIAGANGSGKTKLKQAISNTFRNALSPELSLTIESTRMNEESAVLGGNVLEVIKAQNCQPLQNYMNTRTRGGTYVGTVIQIDSDRSVQAIKFQPITLETPDPDDSEIKMTHYLSPFAPRWQSLVNNIHQKAANRDHKISAFAKENPSKSCGEGLTKYPDPFVPYQEAFAKLLHEKMLEPINPKQPREFHYKVGDAGPFSFQTLSSGEQEVIRVTFDLIWKRIRHSIILVDEPELHLHPTLTFRLIETLKHLGDGTNQLIFFTHSADLISTYYSTGNVYFIDRDAEKSENQAKKLSDLHQDHHETARSAGANLGLFSVGKKMVFIEGTHASVDRFTYHKVAQECFPEAYFLPLGSVKNINLLRHVADELRKAVFGVDLFMIRDRDGLSDEQVAELETNPRFRVFKRRHVENYFLDANILNNVGKHFYLSQEKVGKEQIEDALLQTAQSNHNQFLLSEMKEFVHLNGAIDVPKVPAANELDMDSLVVAIATSIATNTKTLADRFNESEIQQMVKNQRTALETAFNDGTWKKRVPGKTVLARFVGNFWDIDMTSMRQAYVDYALQNDPSVLADIKDILEHFKSLN